MKAGRINSWLSLGANLGVVLGLILLILEIRQNTEMMRAQINQSRTDTAISYLQAVYNSEFMPEIIDRVHGGEELSALELIRYQTYFRAANRSQDNNLWQYNQGFLGENMPRSIRGYARNFIGGSPLGIATWDGQKSSYTDEYVAFVEDAIADMR